MSSTVEIKRPDGRPDRITLQGHWLYVRHCITKDTRGGIVIPEKSRDLNEWCEVLAVGPQVGKRFTERAFTERVRDTITPHLNADGIEVGALILCRRNHPEFMKVSPFDPHEYFIFCDPDVILAVWTGEPTEYAQN